MTNKPTPSSFTGRMPFLSPNQQCQSTEGKIRILIQTIQIWQYAVNIYRDNNNGSAELKGSMKEPNMSICFFFLPITQWCSIFNVLFTDGRGVSDFSVKNRKKHRKQKKERKTERKSLKNRPLRPLFRNEKNPESNEKSAQRDANTARWL